MVRVAARRNRRSPSTRTLPSHTGMRSRSTGIAWERWLELWQQIPLSHIPGYPYWEPQVFRALSENFGVLLRVYSYYAKLSWLRSFASSDTHALTVGGAEWAQFVTDCRMTSAKFDEVQVNKQQIAGTGTAGAYLPEFLSSLLALAFWRGNSFAEGSAEAINIARRERRLRPLPYCIGLVLREHVVPLAHRDSSQRFRARCAPHPPPPSFPVLTPPRPPLPSRPPPSHRSPRYLWRRTSSRLARGRR